MHIVVVEDHDGLREIVVHALEQDGYQVVGVDCAEALVEEPSLHKIDILITDLNLPGEDGLELVQRMRRLQPSLGVIMMTVRNQTQHRVLGYERGADVYLSKPFDLVELQAAVKSLGRRIVADRQSALEQVTSVKLYVERMQLESELGIVKLNHDELIYMVALARANDHRLEYWQMLELISAGGDDLPDRSLLGVKILRLRHKLDQIGLTMGAIQCVRNYGYQLCVPIKIC
ncbi:MAG: response regulator transcription factor [Zetaproteobacteria bacterium]|nr:response regulator transcription factor [Zetaproteobacteria bacterium]